MALIMRPLPCPACRHAMPRALDDTKERVLVAFYSCNSCGHVWATDAARRDYVHFVPEFRRKADRRLKARSGERLQVTASPAGVALILRPSQALSQRLHTDSA
jgi:hypothetical protein